MASYKEIFDVAKIKPNRLSEVKQIADKISKGRQVYEKIAASLRPNNSPQAANIPWWFIGIVHMNEAGGDFSKHLHNGDPLTGRTFQVPANRPERGNPPFTFPQSAIDAISLMQKENVVWRKLGGDWSIEAVLQRLEAYNGLGYKKKGVPNPYLWSFTDQYVKGKYVKDGVYDPNAVSAQPGAAAIMKLLLNYPSTPDSSQSTNSEISQTNEGTGRSEYSEQNNQSGTEQKNNLTSSRITKIFDPTIQPQQFSFETNPAAQAVDETKNGFGYLPVIWYGSFQIDAEQIQFFTIFNDEMAPAMKLSFIDTLGLMRDKAFPLDDTKITAFINSRSDQLKSIFIQFKIRNFTNSNGILIIDGVMDVDSLYVKQFNYYKNLTSNATLQQICKEIGLGFNTNIVDTNDKMTWINSGKKNYDFIEEVLEHAFISDESFIAGYIDYYYSFNFIDIEKELARDVSKDLGIVSTSIEKVFGTKNKNIDDVGPLVLTNDESMSGTNIYFESFRVVNESTSRSLDKGYFDNIKYYDLNDKSSLSFQVNSLTQDSDKSILLKGGPQDKTFFNLNQNFVYSGKLDTDNAHKNFKYSPTQNNRNINEAEKIMIEIQLSHPNYNIYRFQKIMLRLAAKSKLPSGELINQRLSGNWLIADIKYMFTDRSLKQIITLIKRELELSQEELNREVITNETAKSSPDAVTRGTYENPIISTASNIQSVNSQNLPPSSRLTNDGLSLKSKNLRDIIKSVILNLEDGYFHPDMLKPNSDGVIRVKDTRLEGTGEKMFGINRSAGSEYTSCSACIKFWTIIDQSGAKNKWQYNYIPPDPLKSQLLDLAIDIIEPQFQKNFSASIPETYIRSVINSDGRLLYNFVYANSAGPAWFKGWSNEIRKSYQDGKTKSEDLIPIFVDKIIENRNVIGNKSNNNSVSDTGRKIAKIIGVDVI